LARPYDLNMSEKLAALQGFWVATDVQRDYDLPSKIDIVFYRSEST